MKSNFLYHHLSLCSLSIRLFFIYSIRSACTGPPPGHEFNKKPEQSQSSAQILFPPGFAIVCSAVITARSQIPRPPPCRSLKNTQITDYEILRNLNACRRRQHGGAVRMKISDREAHKANEEKNNGQSAAQRSPAPASVPTQKAEPLTEM